MSESSSSSSNPQDHFISYGAEFSRQFNIFFTNALSFIAALSFSKALDFTLKYYIGETLMTQTTWLPWAVAILLLFVCVLLVALLSLWMKSIQNIINPTI